MSVFIIAEAGVNHNGEIELAKQLIDCAVAAGADAVKFQTFVAEKLVSKQAEKSEYQKVSTGEHESQYDMLKRLELTYDEFTALKAYCDQKGIVFLSTPFDRMSFEFLQSIDVVLWKVPSGEITNMPFLIKIANTRKEVILSTGMSTLREVGDAVDVLRENGTEKLTLLHCNTDYPTQMKDVNLRAMQTMKDAFGVDVGYSDHTDGIEVAIAAAAMDATVIEKHFTLDKGMQGPDHMASLEPKQLCEMVKSIRNVEAALGDAEKRPTESEKKNRDIVRKSIICKRNIKKGEKLTEENLIVKRPGNGISPLRWFDVIGQEAVRDFKEDELLEL